MKILLEKLITAAPSDEKIILLKRLENVEATIRERLHAKQSVTILSSTARSIKNRLAEIS